MRSPQFREQVNSIVMRLAQDKAIEGISTADREKLASVVRLPDQYGFTNAIVTSAGWGVMYDAWAADPPGQEGAIFSAVNAAWALLVGEIAEPVAQVTAQDIVGNPPAG